MMKDIDYKVRVLYIEGSGLVLFREEDTGGPERIKCWMRLDRNQLMKIRHVWKPKVTVVQFRVFKPEK